MKKFMAVLAIIALIAFAAPAFAANPFMDVPAGHWSYDAIEQLASRGVISGYPDGSYKGAQPATRYEIASMVARTLAKIDMEKASTQDVELLKKLVLEFKNELDALGVKVSDIDKRVALLEDGIGGWKIRGVFRFDAKFGSSDGQTGQRYQYSSNNKRNEFDKERFRLFLTKQIDENTFFFAQYNTGDNGSGADGIINSGRGDLQNMRWSNLYVDTKLPWDIGFRVGRFAVDFEGDYGLYTDNDALYGDYRTDGFRLSKSFGTLNATAVVGRNQNMGDGYSDEHMGYALDLNYRPNEKLMLGATGYFAIEDSSPFSVNQDLHTYGFYAGYNFTPNVALKGIYYFQHLGDAVTGVNISDNPKAWKAIIDVKQDALKFTSLWIEYMNMDNNFVNATHPMYSIGGLTAANVMHNQPLNGETTKVLFVKAGQQWNDKWDSWLRFTWADFGTHKLDDAYEYGVGVGYQYTPAIKFELAYDLVDYGKNTLGTTPRGGIERDEKESVFRFRTTVNF